ncbi:MAG: hypothetical protein INR68_15400 [Methylobacterium mesophilicum]|nr:hypothetical protein [Methylobacterium mesophilicum]
MEKVQEGAFCQFRDMDVADTPFRARRTPHIPGGNSASRRFDNKRAMRNDAGNKKQNGDHDMKISRRDRPGTAAAAAAGREHRT